MGLPFGFWRSLERVMCHRPVALDQGRSHELLKVNTWEVPSGHNSSPRLQPDAFTAYFPAAGGTTRDRYRRDPCARPPK